MVSTAGGIVIAIVVLLLAAAGGWIVFTQLRARKLGLPPPSLRSYLPGQQSETPYGPPRPAPGGVVGWFNDQVRKFKNRNNRSAVGAYEQSLHNGGDGRRGFGPLDPDEAWDTRVGHEADAYGVYEEQELGGGHGTAYGGSGYNMNLATTPAIDDLEDGRGRQPGRGAGGPGHKNPFDDDEASSLRGVSPRPIDTSGAGASQLHRHDSDHSSRGERRSVFRENV